MVTDLTTGQSHIRGRDGRDYTTQEVEAAKQRAALGDLEAAALLDNVELGKTDEEAAANNQMLFDNCPECQAARARGEQPITYTAEDISRVLRGKRLKPRKLRWRQRKRGPV